MQLNRSLLIKSHENSPLFDTHMTYSIYIYTYIEYFWLVVWNILNFSISCECHHPNWRTHIFQRGRYTTNQWFILGFYQLLSTNVQRSDVPEFVRKYAAHRSHRFVTMPTLKLQFEGCSIPMYTPFSDKPILQIYSYYRLVTIYITMEITIFHR